MEFRSETISRLVRLVAVVALFLGLSETTRLLGISLGDDISPINTLGGTTFALLAVFTAAQLFSAVGLWIKASWGAVLLMGATIAELALLASGLAPVSVSALGLGLRIGLLIAVSILFGIAWRARRARAQD